MANQLPFLSCLVLALCTLSLSADQVFVSIDCGSSAASYKDENGIVWTGDDEYVKNGESHKVATSNSYSPVMDTLRVFKNKTKNCYTIDSVKPGRVLVRTSFYYGNYDGNNIPPRFDIMFDGYYWGTVNNSGALPSQFEVIYITSNERISVCLARLEGGGFPYISAMEVRSLESYMYAAVKNNGQLFTKRRVAFGSNTTIRYPEDRYDRLWTFDRSPPDGSIKVSSNAVFSSALITDDAPPPSVLKKAIISSSPNSSINLYMAFPSINYSVHINMYFSEVTQLTPNQTRSFYIAKDNKPYSPPFSPPYANCTELYTSNITVTPNTTFSLVPANDTTLPPLINAMEVFLLDTVIPDRATNKIDVGALASLQEAFSLLEDWTGDPCLPYSDYAWEWVKCNYDYVLPRVTTILLSGYGLSGFLPDLSSMDALETINLSNNSFRGNIPDFLGALANLQILNLENNQFNGTIPESLLNKKGLILRVSGNPGLKCPPNTSCSISASPPPPPPKPNSAVRMKKKILQSLLASIIPFIMVLQLC